jgi:hypothetical protein
MSGKVLKVVALAAVLSALPQFAYANKLVFNFLHPTYGGNPNMATFLLSGAAAQNQFDGTGDGGTGTGSPDFDFGDGIGNGPVIIINAGDNDIGGPDIGIGGN